MRIRPNWAALTGAALVFILGFVALNVFSVLTAGSDDLRGLYTYRSATVGDGVLLPILAYCLIASIGPLPDVPTVDRWAGVVAGVLGGLGGAATQVQWLVNSQPELNWTLPAPHQFNVPGWYHAVFLTACCAFFATATTLAWFRIRRAAPPLGRLAHGAVWTGFCAIGFAVLLAADNGARGVGIAVTAGISTLAYTAALILAFRGSHLRQVMALGGAGAVPAVCLLGFFALAPEATWMSILPVMAAFCAAAAWSSTLQTPGAVDRVGYTILAGVSGSGPIAFECLASEPTMWGAFVAIVLGVAAVAVQTLLLSVAANARLGLGAVLSLGSTMSALVALGFIGRLVADNPRFAQTPLVYFLAVVIPLLVGMWANDAVDNAVQPLIRAERANVSRSTIRAKKWATYLAVSNLYAATLLSFLVWVIAVIPAGLWISGTQDIRYQLACVGGSLALVIALFVTAPLAKSIHVAVLCCLAYSVAMAGHVVVNGFGNPWQVAISAAAGIYSGVFIFDGVRANFGSLHGLPRTRTLTLSALGCGAVVATTAVWMVGPAVWNRGGAVAIPQALIALGLGATACITLPYLVARNLPSGPSQRQIVIAEPISGVLQDAFVVTALVISVSWLPSFLSARLGVGLFWLAVLVSYYILLSHVYFYVMENNIGHIGREAMRLEARLAESPPPFTVGEVEAAIAALRAHIVLQNRIAFFMLLPVAFLGLVGNSFKKVWSRAVYVLGFRQTPSGDPSLIGTPSNSGERGKIIEATLD